MRYLFRLVLILTLILNLSWILYALTNAITGASSAFITPLPSSSDPIWVEAVAIDGNHTVAATLNNTLLLLQAGVVINQIAQDNFVGGLAYDLPNAQIYLGTADGQIQRFDTTLERQADVMVTGRVVGMKVHPEGGVIVAHGSGTVRGEYFLSYFPQLTEPPQFQLPVGSQISGIGILSNAIVYTTVNAYVTAVTGAGETLWQVRPARGITSLAVDQSKGIIAVGDDRGTIVLFSSAGDELWRASTDGFAIRQLLISSDGLISADRGGYLSVLTLDGDRTFSTRLTTSSINLMFTASPDTVTLFTDDQQRFTVRLRAMSPENPLLIPWALAGVGAIALTSVCWVVRSKMRRERLSHSVIRVWRSRKGYFFVLPAFLLILVFSYVPIVMALRDSFTDLSLHRVPQFVGFENYVTIVTRDHRFWVGMGNLAVLLVANIVKVITFPLLAAELIFWLRSRTSRYLYRTLFVFPAVVPGLVSVLLWRMFYDPYDGLVNHLFSLLGQSHLARAWLGDASTALFAIIGAGFPWISAFPFLVYLGGLLNINPELFDAAAIDGCSGWQRFRFIDVPMLSEQYRLLLFFTIVGTIQSFGEIWVFTQGGPGYATFTPALQMYISLAQQSEFGYASALGVFLFSLIAGLTLLILRLRRSSTLENT